MHRSDAKLVIRDVPILLFLAGLVFAAVGILILLESGIPQIISLILLASGLGVLLLTSVVTITADRITRTLTLDQRSVLRHTIKQVPFDNIIGINVERSVSSGKGGSRYVYRLTLLQKDGQVMPFRSFSSSGRRKKDRWAGELREFLGIQDSNRTPPGMLPLELTQSTGIQETKGVHWQIQPMSAYGATAPTGVRWLSPDSKTTGFFLFLAQKAEGQSSSGFLASLGSMFFRQALSIHGFQPEDTPGLKQATKLRLLDPALERHFMAYTNFPEQAGKLLNSRTAAELASWAGRYPLKQFQSGSRYCQLMTLFGPNGVCLVTMHLLQPDQTYELISLGIGLVQSQSSGFGQIASTF